MIKFKDLLTEAETKEVKIPANIKRLIDKANVLINQSEDGYAIEPDGTWESVYEFNPITVKGKFVFVDYSEPYAGNKRTKYKYNISEYDLAEVLRWVIKAVKKGIKNKDS
jgi:FKBP-type peptidyl-prolyl cis-trans isomerase 2